MWYHVNINNVNERDGVSGAISNPPDIFFITIVELLFNIWLVLNRLLKQVSGESGWGIVANSDTLIDQQCITDDIQAAAAFSIARLRECIVHPFHNRTILKVK